MAPPKSATLPAVIQKELQQTVAIVCYEHVTKELSMKKKARKKRINELFFGNGNMDNVSQIEQLIEGVSHYKNLYVTETVIVTDKNSESNVWKTTDPIFSRRNKVSYVLGKHITRAAIEQASLA